MPRPNREVMADAIEEMASLSGELRRVLRKLEGLDTMPERIAAAVDAKLGPLAVRLDQAIDAIRNTADGLSEHRSHAMQDVSDLGADVRELGARVHQLEKRAANGGD